MLMLGEKHVKKVLMASSALLGVGLIASPAVAADGIKLSIGGFFKTAYMVNFDDDSEGDLGNERNTDGVLRSLPRSPSLSSSKLTM